MNQFQNEKMIYDSLSETSRDYNVLISFEHGGQYIYIWNSRATKTLIEFEVVPKGITVDSILNIIHTELKMDVDCIKFHELNDLLKRVL